MQNTVGTVAYGSWKLTNCSDSQMQKHIIRVKGEDDIPSNFYVAHNDKGEIIPVLYNGTFYKSNEHIYQSAALPVPTAMQIKFHPQV